MKSLLKVSKLLPKLGTENQHEKMATFAAIERILIADGISWTDAGLKLHEFLTQIAGVEDELLEAPKAAAPAPKASGWSQSATPQQFTSPLHQAAMPGFGAPGPTFRTPRPGPTPYHAPSPPPKQPDPRARGTVAQRLDLVQELLRKQLFANAAEKSSLQSIEMMLDSGLPLSRKQINFLSDTSLKL